MMGMYTAAVRAYGWALWLAAFFHPKARQWSDGRKGWKTKHRQLSSAKGQAPLLWVHCASLGEFEQGRPVIEVVRQQKPGTKVLLTFFSPSGYELRKSYGGADFVVYLPLDTPANAREFLDIWAPDVVVFVKYEFWFNLLKEVQRRGLPLFLVSGLFRPGQVFFRPYGKKMLRVLQGFSHLMVQAEASAVLLRGAGVEQVTVAGDTRVDRVAAIAQQAPVFPLVEAFAGKSPILVAGSTWPEDEAVLLPFINAHLPAHWKVIIAPHEIEAAKLMAIEAALDVSCARYSELEKRQSAKEAQVLLIDNIGMLSALYRYGRFAFIGGGFKTGLHNTLEPIAFGLPVVFGPKYGKFEEARYLVAKGGGAVVEDVHRLSQQFKTWEDEQAWQAASAHAKAYIEERQGATAVALKFILPCL